MQHMHQIPTKNKLYFSHTKIRKFDAHVKIPRLTAIFLIYKVITGIPKRLSSCTWPVKCSSEAFREWRPTKDWQWVVCQSSCSIQTARSSDPAQLHLRSFWGLFLVCGIATIVSLLLFLLRTVCQFTHSNRQHRDPAEPWGKDCSQAIYSFFNFIDAKEDATKKMFKQQNNSCEPRVSWVIPSVISQLMLLSAI